MSQQQDPKDMKFIINGEQLNRIIGVLQNLPYNQVFSVFDILRTEIQRQPEKTEAAPTQLNLPLEG